MGEINGFPCGKATRRRVLFFKTSICCFHRSPSKATAPFLLPTLPAPSSLPKPASNEGDTWIRDYIAAMKSNLSIHGTMDRVRYRSCNFPLFTSEKLLAAAATPAVAVTPRTGGRRRYFFCSLTRAHTGSPRIFISMPFIEFTGLNEPAFARVYNYSKH